MALLMITIYKMSNTQFRNLIKITKVRKASSYKPWSRFKAERLSAQQQSTCTCGLAHGCVIMLSNSQGFELSDFAVMLQLHHKETGIQPPQCMQYATAHASRAAMKLIVCCYDNRSNV